MKRAFGVFALILSLALCVGVPVFADGIGAIAKETVKNVIILIPDGMSVAGTTLARFYKGSALAMDGLACGLVSTWNSDGTIADSAPAGSAFATGWKSQTGNIASTGKAYALADARTPDADERLRPVATVLEAARLSGRATGIVCTSEFMHATPADFSAHDPARSNYDNIAEQIVYNRLDVILGGGRKYLSPSARKDKEDLWTILQAEGYGIVDTTVAMKNYAGSKLVGVFGKDDATAAMSYDIDRIPEREPALETMTAKAIEILSADPDGFFLMVEGSKVDWAAHANDPVGIVTDILAFDRAVKVALDFAKKDGNTVIVAVTDHGNSGISIGDKSTSKGYDKTPWAAFIDPLKKAKVTGEGLEAKLPANLMIESKDANGKSVKVFDVSKAPEIRKAVAEYYGIADLSDAEVEAIAKTDAGSLNYTVGPMIAARARIGFTTTGHTGEDVVLYAYDPRGLRPTGAIDNTDIGEYLASSLGVDLDRATKALFLDAVAAFGSKGAVVVEDKADPENPVLIVTKGVDTLSIPRNKSIAYLNGNLVQSDGVTVYNGTSWFVARNLVNLIH